jgi:hypothetical protein
MNLELQDVDLFLVDRIKAKLKYWSSIDLSFIGITLIMNNVLMSFLWYFTVVGVGSKKVLRKIKALLHDNLWLGL